MYQRDAVTYLVTDQITFDGRIFNAGMTDPYKFQDQVQYVLKSLAAAYAHDGRLGYVRVYRMCVRMGVRNGTTERKIASLLCLEICILLCHSFVWKYSQSCFLTKRKRRKKSIVLYPNRYSSPQAKPVEYS